MDYFHYVDGRLHAEDVDVSEIAEAVGTPAYVYSKATINLHIDRLREAFAEVDPLVLFSVKANGNLEVLRTCAEAGTGFDIVSGGELYRALKAGGDPSRIAYAGVGKTAAEIEYALEKGVLLFNVESEGELEAISEIAGQTGKTAPVALRINPAVDSHAHDYTTTARRKDKFGIALEEAERIVRNWVDYPNCSLVGVDMHIGSQITETTPYGAAIDRLLVFCKVAEAAGHKLEYFDLGGGFGIFYRGGEARDAAEFAGEIVPRLKGKGLSVILEPGRFVVGNAGVLLTNVTYVKRQSGKRFVICDVAMNDLLRPSIYGAYHRIWPACTHLPFSPDETADTPLADIVGPVCESGDFMAKERPLPHVARGDLLVIFGAGAYGMTMASNYNARPRAPEVMVDGSQWRVVRRRETFEDLVRPEVEVPE
ncbi:MAG: diaminopimelate decarboxylase [Planctomycetota bacterium]|jgi:diaminopimelate decarboxylase